MSHIPPHHFLQPIPLRRLHILNHLFRSRHHLGRITFAEHVRRGYVPPRGVAGRAAEDGDALGEEQGCPVSGLGLGEVLVENGFGCCGGDGHGAGLCYGKGVRYSYLSAREDGG